MDQNKKMNWMNIVLVITFLELVVSHQFQESTINSILQQGISNRVYPGVVAAAGNKSGKVLFLGALGTHEYLDEHPDSPPVSLESIYDLASVTKVLATTSAVALLYQRGHLQLTDRIGDLLYDHRYGENGGKENVTVLNCLLHNAGYLPDPVPGYYDPSFACDQKFESEKFSCLNKIYNSLLFENLQTIPGTNYNYSDLSFITLQYVIGSIVFHKKLQSVKNIRSECFQEVFQHEEITESKIHNYWDLNRGLVYTCYFEAFVRKEIFLEDYKWLTSTAYLPTFAFYSDQNLTIPTMDTSYTKEIRKGNVSDSNCYAMGGICGHAGVFSVAGDIQKILSRFLHLTAATTPDNIAPYHNWINSTTMKLFTKEYDDTQSSRAFGWTTNDPKVSNLSHLLRGVTYSFFVFE